MRLHNRLVLLVSIGAVTASVLTACGSSGGSGGAASSAPAPTPVASTSSAAGASAGAVTGKKMTASLTEFKIALNTKTVSAGTYTIQVKNAGSLTRALTVDGPGVSNTSTGDMSPGSSKTITVTLKPGKYDVFCPVGNHKMEGMDDTVTVN